ncbi:MAG: hypothetical protein AAF990_24355 [Bacteroidota bacterium]
MRPAQVMEMAKKANALPTISPRGLSYKSMLSVLYAHSIGDYKLIANECSEVLKTLAATPGVFRSYYHFFLVSLGVAQIALKKYKAANKSFSQATLHVYRKTHNEYILKFYQTINALHAEQYQKAYNIVASTKRCKFEDIRQQFAIIEAYLCFLARFGYLTLNKTFRIGKYLNETIKAQSDKQGSNIAILIAELLVYLSRDRAKFIDRVEAVNNYSYRHLKDRETRRAKQFIQILCKIPRANFNAVALRRIAQRQIQYLENNPMWMGNNFAVEVIPFERLFEMILDQLQRKVA